MESDDVLELFESIYAAEYDGAPDSAYLRGPFVCEGERIPENVVRLFAARVLERAAKIADDNEGWISAVSMAGDAIRSEAQRVREGK